MAVPKGDSSSAKEELWADKYRPRSVNEMCAPAMAQRLRQWLQGFAGELRNPQSQAKKACLLSGPPGVGKTTTVHLVASELGFQVIEFNASDHRSAKSLHQSVADVVDNRSMSGLGFGKDKAGGGFFSSVNRPQAAPPTDGSSSSQQPQQSRLSLDRFVILMDEVDGCDRGGVAEVINMIKRTKVPILCTCNDRWHQKLRSLVNHVEDLKFSRPAYNVVASWIQNRILVREQCTVPPALLQDVVKLEGNDIRSVLNNLQLWCRANKNLSEQELARAARSGFKNEDIGLFNAAESFLLQGSSSMANQPRKTLEELQSLYFSADLIDLFVQENYIHFKPERADDAGYLKAVARGAASISRSDVVRRMVFEQQNWSVSTYHVLASAIFPCAVTRGHYQTFVSGPAAGFDRSRPVKFPQWLGANSTTGKNNRLAVCVAKQGQNPDHGFSANAEEIVTDYCPVLAARLTRPLAEKGKDGVPEVLPVMDNYKLIRDDWDYVQEVCKFKKMATPGHQQRLTAPVTGPVKSALTRAYNASHKTDRQQLRAKLGVVPEAREDGGGDDDDEDEDEGESQLKRNRSEAVAPVAPAAAKAKAKAPAKPRAKKAPAPKKAANGGSSANPMIL